MTVHKPRMPGAQRAHIAACAGVIGFALAYVACHFARLPRLTYFQHARQWHLIADPTSSIPSAYVGMILWGLFGAILATVLALALTRLRKAPVGARWLHLFTAWAVAAFALAAAYYVWQLLFG